MGKSVKPFTPSKTRGRPRSELAKQAVLRAARELLDEVGPGAVTIEALAARAGVGKPTIYRWWPDRHAVLMTALMEADAAATEDSRPRSSALSGLRLQLRRIVARFATTTGRHVTSLIAASDAESELSKAFRSHFVLARRAEGSDLLEQAIVQQEVRADLHIEVVLDMLYGPLFFRLLLGHAPLDERFVDQLLDEALRGVANPSPVRP